MDKRMIVTMVVCLSGLVWADNKVVDLSWNADGFSQSLQVEPSREGPFAKEPDAKDKTVFRGRVWLGGDKPAGFLWIKEENKVYVDINQDGDLTNDPNGVLKSQKGDYESRYDYWFEPLVITRDTEFGRLQYNINVRVYSYSDTSRYAYFSLKSGYRGIMEIDGHKWRIGIANLPSKNHNDGFVCQLSQESDSSWAFWDMPKELFFGGQNFASTLRWAQKQGTPVLQMVLEEKPVPMGQLDIAGQRICSLILKSKDRIAFPGTAQGQVPIPAGDYHCLHLALTAGDKEKGSLQLITPQGFNGLNCVVTEGAVGVFKAGAPLNHTVKVECAGNTLTFSYQLVGLGGEQYDPRQVTGYNNDKKPKVEIYKGDILLASGDFEFG